MDRGPGSETLVGISTIKDRIMSTDNTTLATRIENRIDKAETHQITLNESGALAFSSAAQIMEFAKIMSLAAVAIPKHLRENPGACLAVAIQASEWGMSPFAVANKSYSVNDRLAYEAQLVNAVILKRAPIKGRFKIFYTGDGQQRKCKVSATLEDGETVEYESPAIEKIKVKNSPLWQSDPDQQLFYFSSRSMCRRHFPDVLLGVYTPDELEEPQIRQTTGREVTARAVPLDPFQPALPEPEPVDEAFTDFLVKIGEAHDIDELEAYMRDASDLEADQRQIAKEAIIKRSLAGGYVWNEETKDFGKA